MVGKNLSHYKILEELGRGGMGIVYKAEDTKLDRTVAIKVLPSAALSSEDDRARFYREAKAAAQLHHPHIASVFEIDEAVPSDAPHGTEPSPFIAMEYIEGETLEDHIKQGPLKLEEAVRIASQIASGLEAAHEKDIVHRDLKSQNVMLTSKGEAKILDFGLAQTAASTKLTRTGSALGTVAYMSPEQARGEDVDRRTDIWSLGVVSYEMVAGISPFPGAYDKAVVYSILNQEPEPLTAIRTGVSMSLESLVTKCLAKDREYRYQTVTELQVDLRRINLLKESVLGRTSEISDRQKDSTLLPLAVVRKKNQPLLLIGLVLGALIIGYLLGKGMLFSAAESPTPSWLNFIPEDGVEIAHPSWSDSGKQIYYVRTIDSWDSVVESFELETGRRRSFPLTRGAQFVSAGWKEESFIFTIGNAIFLVEENLNEPVLVADDMSLGPPSWSSERTITYRGGGDFILERDIFSGATDTLVSEPVVELEDGRRLQYLIGIPVGNRLKSLLFFTMSHPTGNYLLEYDRTTDSVKTVGRGIPRLLVGNDYLISFDHESNVYAAPLDRNGKLTSSRIRLFEGVEFSISSNGHAIFKPGISVGEPVSTISTTGDRHLVGNIPGLYGIGGITVSHDGDIVVAQGRYQDQESALLAYDMNNGSSWVLDPGFGASRMAFGADGLLYFDTTGEPSIIYRARVEKTGLHDVEKVLPDNVHSGRPSASKNGDVVFLRRTDDLARVFHFDQSSGNIRQVSNQVGGQSFPSIHPDGRYVAYRNMYQGNSSLILEDLITGVRQTISERIEDPIFSLDGKALYYQEATRIHRISLTIQNGIIEPGLDEIVAHEPFNDHLHFAPGAGDIAVYVSSPPSALDTKESFQIVMNYRSYLDDLFSEY